MLNPVRGQHARSINSGSQTVGHAPPPPPPPHGGRQRGIKAVADPGGRSVHGVSPPPCQAGIPLLRLGQKLDAVLFQESYTSPARGEYIGPGCYVGLYIYSLLAYGVLSVLSSM